MPDEKYSCTYGDIDENFYNSIEGMYEAVVNDMNKCKDSKIFRIYSDRLTSVIDNTRGIGWGFHDGLKFIYSRIKWLDLEHFDINQSEVKNIK